MTEPPGRLHHVAVAVSDPDAAFSFYRDVLGLAPIDRPDGADAIAPGAWFQLPNAQLHLFTPPDPTVQPPHFAIEVEDLTASFAAIRERGIAVYDQEHSQGFGYQAFVLDPAGNLIELNQPD